MCADGPDVGGIPWQMSLEAHDAVEDDGGNQAERDQADRVARPTLLDLRIDAHQPVRDSLDRVEEAIAGRSTVGFGAVDLGHVAPEGRDGDHQEEQQEEELQERGADMAQNFSGNTSTSTR